MDEVQEKSFFSFFYIYVMDSKYDVILWILLFVSLGWVVIDSNSLFIFIGYLILLGGVVGWWMASKKKK